MNKYQVIKKSNWDRLAYYEFFNDFHDPSYSMTKEFLITDFYKEHKQARTLPIALTHMVTHAINQVPEFKQRDKDSEIIQWDTISPSLTVKNDIGHFSFCHIPYSIDFDTFKKSYQSATTKAAKNTLFDPHEPNDSHKFFMSMIPWVDFTHMTHPIKDHPVDHFPRIAVSKCSERADGSISVAVNCQVNHKFIDGQHLGQFFHAISDYLRT